MDATEVNAFQRELVSRYQQLYALEVMEMAECVVRTAYRDYLARDMDDACRRLQVAVKLVTLARAGDDLIEILHREHHLCVAQQQVRASYARRDRLVEAVKRAGTAYQAKRQLALQRIDRARATLDSSRMTNQ